MQFKEYMRLATNMERSYVNQEPIDVYRWDLVGLTVIDSYFDFYQDQKLAGYMHTPGVVIICIDSPGEDIQVFTGVRVIGNTEWTFKKYYYEDRDVLVENYLMNSTEDFLNKHPDLSVLDKLEIEPDMVCPDIVTAGIEADQFWTTPESVFCEYMLRIHIMQDESWKFYIRKKSKNFPYYGNNPEEIMLDDASEVLKKLPETCKRLPEDVYEELRCRATIELL